MTVADRVVTTQKIATEKIKGKATTAVKKVPSKAAAQAAVKAVAKPKKPAAPAKPTAKVTVNATLKPAAKPVAKPAVKVAPTKHTKVKKPKMVRDSFTFPKAEYAVLESLKMRAAKLDSPAKKTELLRAGIKAIAAMQDTAFVAALKSVPSLKTGRPAKAG